MRSPVNIRFAGRAYDGVLPILRGQLGMPGFELAITETYVQGISVREIAVEEIFHPSTLNLSE
jgi:hypothetical protein